MGETRKLNQDYIPFFNRNVFFKALNIINIYTFNAMFRQPRVTAYKQLKYQYLTSVSCLLL